MEQFLAFISHPATVALIVGIGTYLTTQRVNKATAGKTTTEGIVLAVDKVVELSGTIYTLHQSLIATESEKSILKVKFDTYKDTCEETKAAVREFFANTDAIYKGVGDKIIIEQVENLQSKLSK